jgi:hypothetical protein
MRPGRRANPRQQRERVDERGEEVDSASLVIGLRTNVRRTRGEYWVLDIWRATSVMENTTPVKVSSAVAMVASSVRASSKLVGKSPWWSVKLRR